MIEAGAESKPAPTVSQTAEPMLEDRFDERLNLSAS